MSDKRGFDNTMFLAIVGGGAIVTMILLAGAVGYFLFVWGFSIDANAKMQEEGVKPGITAEREMTAIQAAAVTHFKSAEDPMYSDPVVVSWTADAIQKHLHTIICP